MTATQVEAAPVCATQSNHSPIPLSRVIELELRKMFDTRSGFWLMASIGITALLATIAVIAFAPDDELTYETFASAVGFPMAIILPIIAVLSVTSEWSQRTGRTTFTFVPHRGRVISAKALGAIGVGFMLGALTRNSPGAIVAHFVYSFVLPPLSQILAATQDWWRDLRPWVDFYLAQTALFDGGPTAEQWANIGVSGIFWLLIPLAVGLRLVLRSEVK